MARYAQALGREPRLRRVDRGAGVDVVDLLRHSPLFRRRGDYRFLAGGPRHVGRAGGNVAALLAGTVGELRQTLEGFGRNASALFEFGIILALCAVVWFGISAVLSVPYFILRHPT